MAAFRSKKKFWNVAQAVPSASNRSARSNQARCLSVRPDKSSTSPLCNSYLTPNILRSFSGRAGPEPRPSGWLEDLYLGLSDLQVDRLLGEPDLGLPEEVPEGLQGGR